MEPIPLWPAEFYLRLTSRCCHHCSTGSTSLINLSLSSTLLHLLSLHSLLLCSLSVSLSSNASHYQQASLFTLVKPLPFISLTNKVESKHLHRYTHAHANRKTHTCSKLLKFGLFDGCWLPSAGVATKSNTQSIKSLIFGAQL